MELKEFLQTKKCKAFLTVGIIIATVLSAAVLLMKSNDFSDVSVLQPKTTSAASDSGNSDDDRKYTISVFMARAERFGFSYEYEEMYSKVNQSEFSIITDKASDSDASNPRLTLTFSKGEITACSLVCSLKKTDASITADDDVLYDLNKLYEKHNKNTLSKMTELNEMFIKALDKNEEIDAATVSEFVQLANKAYVQKATQTLQKDGYIACAAFKNGENEDEIIFSVSKEAIDV